MSVDALNYASWVDVSSSYACEAMNRVEKPCYFEDTNFMDNTCGNFSSFMLLLQTIMMNNCEIADSCRRPETNYIEESEVFDFIVVGAGLAGPVIARRLADHDPPVRVLLIEAGPSEPTMASLPGFAFNAIDSELDWKFKTEPTEPEPTACLSANGVCNWPRGKMISGTSGLYGMMYVRGHPDVYDSWAKNGSKGWSYDEIEKYFDRAEDFVSSDENLADESIEKGPLKVQYFNHIPPFASVILDAAAELGYSTPSWKGPKQTGFMHAPMITDNGQRGTTSRFYLRPIAYKENLKILTNAYVTKLIKNEQDNGVYGVELIDSEGNKKIIDAEKEVILSAGAIGSPQILLSSGIGPKEDLQETDIPLWQDLPVGKNLHNHVSIGIQMSINDTEYQTVTLDSIDEFLKSRSGPLSSTGITQITAFLESTFATPGVPDIQIFFDGFVSTCPNYGATVECRNGKIETCPSRRVISARPTALIVKSRGVLKLRSNNPALPPLIYPNYFVNEQDLKIVVEGIKKVVELTETDAMKAWDLRLEDTSVPQCSMHQFATDDYWECLIRVETGPENHQAGSCKMGAAEDESSVVDPELRVIGVPGLRVADASIFPSVPNSNPAAGIIMVAEKAADMITKTWEKL